MNGSISLWSIAVPGELHEKTTKTTIKRMIQLMDTVSAGASLGSLVIPVEVHASATWTEVFGLNVLDTLEKLKGDAK